MKNVLYLVEQLASEIPFVSSGTVLMLVIPIYQGLFILLTVSVVLMVNKRLLMEIGKEEEKFAKAFQSSSESVVLASLLDGMSFSDQRRRDADRDPAG